MLDFWNKVLELFKSSVITQSIVTLALVVTLCVLWGLGRTVDPQLYQLTVLVVGFWFGSKVGYSQGQSSGGG